MYNYPQMVIQSCADTLKSSIRDLEKVPWLQQLISRRSSAAAAEVKPWQKDLAIQQEVSQQIQVKSGMAPPAEQTCFKMDRMRNLTRGSRKNWLSFNKSSPNKSRPTRLRLTGCFWKAMSNCLTFKISTAHA